MRKLMSIYNGTYSLLALMFLVIARVSNSQAIESTTAHNTESEKMTIPHSHPILTLHTRHNKPQEID
tara:strand:+ start:886 stop:1086 length:201 start_codon:yes stop_codon:yes gene_type:complete